MEKLIPVFFVLGHTVMNVFSNIFYKKSADVKGIARFGLWQIVAGTFSFIGVLSYTFSLKYLPVSVAFPVTQGLAVVGVTIIGAWLVYKEKIQRIQWLAMALITIGILFVSIK
jgi:multidrug transporter EmrE-like cation transporter